jgi:hypothetical protein
LLTKESDIVTIVLVKRKRWLGKQMLGQDYYAERKLVVQEETAPPVQRWSSCERKF